MQRCCLFNCKNNYHKKKKKTDERAGVCTNLPEPKNLLATSGVMSVDGVSLPIHKVNLLHPTEHDLNVRRSTYCIEIEAPQYSYNEQFCIRSHTAAHC